MTPFAKTIVPFAIGAEVTGTIVALRMATVGFLPGLLRITDCAKSGSDGRRARGDERMRVTRLLIGHLRLRLVVASCAGLLLVLRFVVRFFLQAIRLLLRQRCALARSFCAVEDDLAFDEASSRRASRSRTDGRSR